MNALFIALRILTAMSSLGAFILWCLVVFVRDTASLAKEGVGVLGYAAKLFASGFTEGVPPNNEPWRLGPWQISIGMLALAMLVSVFTPGAKWLLHCVAGVAILVMLGYARMVSSGPSLEIVCLPFLLVWFLYYAMSLMWRPPTLAP